MAVLFRSNFRLKSTLNFLLYFPQNCLLQLISDKSKYFTPLYCIIILVFSACGSTEQAPHLTITSQNLPLIKNPLSPARLVALQNPNTLYNARLKDTQLPHGYVSIVNLSISTRSEKRYTIPGVPPKIGDDAFSTTTSNPLNNLPAPIELRTTSPAQCLSLLTSPVNNQPTPVTSSSVKTVSIGYFGPEFHQIHEELLLYPNDRASLNAFAEIIQSETSCKKFVITGADGGKSTAIFSRGPSPKLGMKALSYVILDDLIYRLEEIHTSYVYLGPLLVHITLSIPSTATANFKFTNLVRTAVNDVISSR